ncbi:MAG: hypothetical protein ACPGO3_04885 [Magnetospiraceae bacterium]
MAVGDEALQVLRGEQTPSEAMVGTVTSVGKTAMSTGAGLLIGRLIISTVGGPYVAAVTFGTVIGIGINMLLNITDNKTNFTQNLKDSARETGGHSYADLSNDQRLAP